MMNRIFGGFPRVTVACQSESNKVISVLDSNAIVRFGLVPGFFRHRSQHTACKSCWFLLFANSFNEELRLTDQTTHFRNNGGIIEEKTTKIFYPMGEEGMKCYHSSDYATLKTLNEQD